MRSSSGSPRLPIVVGDQVVGRCGGGRGRHCRQQMQRDLETAHAAAEQASMAKSSFLASVSHEPRTPLTSVLAASELLEDTDLAPEQGCCLVRSSDLASVCSDSSTTSWTYTNRGRPEVVEVVEFDLRSLVADLAQHAGQAAAGKGPDFDCIVGPNLPAPCRVTRPGSSRC